ncbi:MAG: DUF2844 domain-containing protein [Zoogloeaceae bacterium]|nr:DUF2844 domain-containing protein [Zoogloeaceae bacterium]
MKKLVFLLVALLVNVFAHAYDGLGYPFTGKTAAEAQPFVPDNSASAAGYTVQVTMEGETVVKEYVDNNYIIFAVTWSGVILPDLSALLGQYARHDGKERGSGLRHRVIEDNDLVVSKNYSSRSKRGYAYLKSKLPAQFDPALLAP